MIKISFILAAALLSTSFLTTACSEQSASDAGSQVSSMAGAGSVGVIGGAKLENDLQQAATVGVYMYGGYCSGSYIGNNTIITASHCIHAGNKAYKVAFNHPAGVFNCDVTKQFEHPDYQKDQMPWFDIAVLKIQCKDPKYADIQPYIYNTETSLSGEAYSAGYGLTSIGGSYNFPHLSFMKLTAFDMNQALHDPSIDPDMAKSDRLPELVERIKEGRLDCFRSDLQQSVFMGDSGGPQYTYRADGRYVLVGVNDVLYTRNEDVKSLYAFCSARVDFFKDWVAAQN